MHQLSVNSLTWHNKTSGVGGQGRQRKNNKSYKAAHEFHLRPRSYVPPVRSSRKEHCHRCAGTNPDSRRRDRGNNTDSTGKPVMCTQLG